MSGANHCLFFMPGQNKARPDQRQIEALLQAHVAPSVSEQAVNVSTPTKLRGTEGRHRGDHWIGVLDVAGCRSLFSAVLWNTAC